jgi:hypothetical protein
LYEQGEKATKLPAHQIRKSEASRLIPQIRTLSGATTVIHKEINDQFKQFYSALYSSESPQDPLLIDSVFNGLNMPSIDTDSHDCLEEEFTPEEIATAVKSGKSPGPDGFPTKFKGRFLVCFAHSCLDYLQCALIPQSYRLVFISGFNFITIKEKQRPPGMWIL